MARVIAFVPDLLFGSNVVGALRAAGHDPVLVSSLGAVAPDSAEVLVVDLTAEVPARLQEVAAAKQLATLPKLAFYSHVEANVRSAAQQAGFDVVVPRSRMAREGAALVTSLVAG